MSKRVVLLVGTSKGAFFFHSDQARREWHVSGPHLSGWGVDCLLGEPGGKRIFAGTSHMAYGATLRVSDDFGSSWRQVLGSPHYKKESGRALKRLWQLAPGAPSETGTLYAGASEAGLFVSRDRGESWQELEGLSRHPTRPYWQPGGGGLSLHTVLVDPGNPQRLWVGISVAGVFRSEDGGASWTTCHKGLPDTGARHPCPEVAHNAHKLAQGPRNANTLYLQHVHGVYKSTDGGDSWFPVEEGLPGTFGFPICTSPTGDVFVMPLASSEERYMKDGRLCVYRLEDGGERWQAFDRGLPGNPSFVGVLRDAMSVDALEPYGVYFGTTGGELFYSLERGERWQRLPGQFSRILTVQAWVLED